MGQRERITEQTRRWARHVDDGDVFTTSSFANMEALLRREYFGRFVIELVQNARDAWFAAGHGEDESSVVRVLLHGDPPVLVVANQGVALDADGLIRHITQFGESSKRAGEGIGHKGIGFKSVLELTHCPEILSRADLEGPFELRVRFDPRLTRALIDEVSAEPWAELVKRCDPTQLKTAEQRVPILRFPHWIDVPDAAVEGEASHGGARFNTLVRLPYDGLFDRALGLNRTDWLARVREAMGGLSDEIVMLLGGLSRVHVDDALAGCSVEVNVDSRPRCALRDGATVREVAIRRNAATSSRWLLYERRLDDPGLSGELAVGVCIRADAGRDVVVLPSEQTRCFHLFFPTRIQSHLPFLFHAYFEVDAGRSRFAPDASARNAELLAALRELAVLAVEDLVSRAGLDTTSLPSLFGHAAGEPEEPLARDFRKQLLEQLDAVRWVPVRGSSARAAPREVLVHDVAEVSNLLPAAFPPDYLSEKAKLFHPERAVVEDPAARGFLFARAPTRLGGDTGVLKNLLLPGEQHSIWAPDGASADAGFGTLMRLLATVSSIDSSVEAMLRDLRGVPAARIVPTVSAPDRKASSARVYRCPPEAQRGRGTPIFARVRSVGSEEWGADAASSSAGSRSELGVPECLAMAFVADEALDQALLTGPAASLGIRPFGTESVLEQLPIEPVAPADAPAVAEFVWRMLLRESVSRYGVKTALSDSKAFEPGRWFWCNPWGIEDEVARRDVQRRQALAHVALPARDGTWRRATELSFGNDWAGVRPSETRSAAYADLEALADAPARFVASPEVLAEQFPLRAEDVPWLDGEVLASVLPTEPASVSELTGNELRRVHRELLHSWLLSLGVWEVPPLDGFLNDLRAEASAVDPAGGQNVPGREAWLEHITDHRREWFGVSYSHEKVRIACDCRFAWPLPTDGTEPTKAVAFARALSRGAPFYRRLLHTSMFCTGCGRHKSRIWSRADCEPNSFLAWQLSRTRWVPVTIDARSAGLRRPGEVWWTADPADDPARIQTNPRRFLPLAARGVGVELITALGAHRLEDPSVSETVALLKDLRDRFEQGTLPVDIRNASAQQAFVGLHRQLYGQLAKAGADEVRAKLDEVGVLANSGSGLAFVPRSEVLFNDGRYNAFRRHFVGRVCFSVLNVGEDDIARALDLPRFEVTCKMAPPDSTEDQTAEVCEIIDSRLAEIMALLTHMSLGGRPLDIGSDAFRQRSQRLRELSVLRIPDVRLELSVTVPGMPPISATDGEGADRDVYLDWQPGRKPVLFHDFQGPDWLDQVRRRLGDVVAQLTENAAFRDTFSLFFQYDGEARELFLAERGVTAAGLDEVRRALGRTGAQSKRLAANMVQALGSVLSVELGADENAAALAEQRLAELGWGDEESRRAVARGMLAEDARTDTARGGLLHALERNGVKLGALHRALLDMGDPGLTIRVAEALLRGWVSHHGDKVVFALQRSGLSTDDAKAKAKSWRPAEATDLRLEVRLDEVLDGPVADLAAAGVAVTAVDLLPDRVDAVLAERLGIPLTDWATAWRSLFSSEEAARLARQRALARREAATVSVVTLITRPGELQYRIRHACDAYLMAVSGSVASIAEVAVAIRRLLEERKASEAAAELLAHLEAVSDVAPADSAALEACVPVQLRAHLEEVRRALRTQDRERLDRIRANMDELRHKGVRPAPVVSAAVSPKVSRTTTVDKKAVNVGKVVKRDLERIGAAGEGYAIAAVMQPLRDLFVNDQPGFAEAVSALQDFIDQKWKGAAVERVLPNAERAVDSSLSEDDRLQAVVDLVHLSLVSDAFGCDMVGWLSPSEGAPPKAMALEVKSAAGPSFLASDPEWREAERLGEDYAFLVVVRDGASVKRMDLLVNPKTLLKDGRIERSADTWKARYGPQA